jgi:predicted amidophosphoribosyltransferase
MNCPQCRKEFAAGAATCPHCGAKNLSASGVFQTSTVLISTERADRVYRSVDDVPLRLRNRLLKTTNGANSATILIADRKGRKEIDKAMRKLPATQQRRMVHSILSGARSVDPLGWLTPPLRKWIAVAVALLAVLVAVGVFVYKGYRP